VASRVRAPWLIVIVGGLGLALGSGCNEPAPVSAEEDPETLEGTACDQPGLLQTGHECRTCVCTEEGVWHCPRTTCAWNVVPEPEAGLLIVVDDSSSMGPDRQARLARAMPSLLAEIDRYPNPITLRVAVTTTDHTSPACDPATADDGALQLRSCQEHLDDFAVPAGPTEEPIPADAAARACESVCELPELRTVPTAVSGSTELRARPWLERRGDRTNLEGDPDFAAALACAIPQGLHGCDFESPLQATVSALWRSLDPDDPASGFVGPADQVMALIVTDEADCSAAEEWGTVFDPEGSRRFWSDPEAEAPTSAVCWNAGVVCEGGPGTYDTCYAENIDTAEHVGVPSDNAVLTPVSTLRDELRDIADAWSYYAFAPGFIELTMIGGGPPGYATDEAELVYTDGQDDPDFALRYGVGPGCRDDDEAAVPPARLLGAADEVVGSICEDDYGPALAAVGRRLVENLPPPCYWGCAEDADREAPGLQPTCWAQEESPDGGVRLVPPCDGDQLPSGAEACLELRHDEALSPQCAADGFNLELEVHRDPSAPRPDGGVRVFCLQSNEPERDCPRS